MNQINYKAINIGFGNLADEYDRLQLTNKSVRLMREKFYKTIIDTVPAKSYLLELNCGSGIDAHYLAEKGYRVLAADISDKMIKNATSKEKKQNLEFRKLSYSDLNQLHNEKFDAVISNLGGFNCIDDLSPVANEIKTLLNPGGYLICTLMPHFSIWELALFFRGEVKRSFRRLKKKGTIANVGNEKVFVRYYSPSELKKFLGQDFNLIQTKALRIFSPPPPADYWYSKHPVITSLFDKLDNKIEMLYSVSFICDNFISVFRKK